MSVLDFKRDYIFIHVPKNAGTSMEKILGGGGHKSIAYYKDFIENNSNGLNMANFFSFGFVRSPYERFVSAMAQNYRNSVSEFTPKTFRKMAKEQWWRTADIFINSDDWHFATQESLLCVDGKIAVDFVGRFENIENDWKVIQGELNIYDDLPFERRGDYDSALNWYDKQTKEIVSNFYQKDFKIFNYEV